MDIAQIADLGATGLIALVLYLIVKMFINYLSKRDDQFGLVISNHINSNTKALTELQDTNRELLTWLKNKNGN